MQLDELPMRVAAGQFSDLTDEIITFTQQVGLKDVQFNMYGSTQRHWDYTDSPLPGNERWEYIDLLMLRTRCEDAGLRLNAIENTPTEFYDKAMLGLPGRDEQIENMQYTIRNIGRAGIPIFGYHFMPSRVWRTSSTTPARGGAEVTSFDMELVKNAPLTYGRVFTADEMWANYEYYIKAILPVAEEEGVLLALHPDDPPVPSLGGVARIMSSFEGFQRAMQIGDSPNHGLNFCVGTWSEMGPEIVPQAIRHFAAQSKIFYVHFRDVLGTVPKFREAFVDEGNLNMFEIMKLLRDVGFKGFMLDDHVPHMVGDSGWASRSRAYAIGQMNAMLRILNGA
jgi:mannonate dehydratase